MNTLTKMTLSSLTLASTLLASQALAHGLNMWPSQFNINSKKPTTVTVDLSFSETPFRLDHSVSAAGLSVIDPQGKTLRYLGNIYQSAQRTTLDLAISEQGTYTVTYQNQPRYTTSYTVGSQAKKKRLRLNKSDAQSELPNSAKNVVTKKSVTTAIAFITNIRPSKQDFKPTGKGLELVPVTHPSDYVTNDVITMKLYLNGQPLRNATAKLQRSGAQYLASNKPSESVTDANGQLSYQFDQGGLFTLSVKHSEKQNAKLYDEMGYRLFYSFEISYE